MYAIGIDIGSTGTKGVLWRDGIVDEELLPTGWNHREAGLRALQTLLSRQGIGKGDVACVVATGYGRKTADFADTTVTEITCHAKGAAWLLPEAKSVLDIGGQDSKAILLGSSGDVVDFLMNDKCAAGTGRFLQVMSHLLDYDLDELGDISADMPPEKISSMCTVFAESEVIGLLAEGAQKSGIAVGLLDAMASRAAAMLRKIGAKPPVAFTGGASRCRNLVKLVARHLEGPVLFSPKGQMAGALGAALVGSEKGQKKGGEIVSRANNF